MRTKSHGKIEDETSSQHLRGSQWIALHKDSQVS